MNYFILQFETWWLTQTCVSLGSLPRFVVDGQAPLRQCLHPECYKKDLELPETYNSFYDLRKEFTNCYSSQGELATLSIQEMVQCILFLIHRKKSDINFFFPIPIFITFSIRIANMYYDT